MELRERAEQMIKPQTPIVIPPVTRSIRQLTRMERLAANRRWLRGAMCFLAVICYALSLFEEGRVVTHSIILLFSLAGEVAIVCIHRVKAKFHGITNRASGKRREVSVFHSPSLINMLLEMLVWILQCPPLPDDMNPEWLVGLDGFLILRFYVFLLYGTHVAHTSVFSHAIASLARIRLNYRFFIRTAFLLEHLAVTLCAVAAGIFIFACSYAKAEGATLGESFYFCVSTASLAGYSETSPVTFPGRVIAVCVTLLGVIVLCWTVGVMNEALSLTEAERNLYTLFRNNELCGKIPPQAARLIQRTWKLYRAKRDRHNFISRQIAAFLLSQQAITYRGMRRALIQYETAFLLSTRTLEECLASNSTFGSNGTTPLASSNTSPLGSPRTRRPFPLYQEMRLKRDSRASTPRGDGFLQEFGNEFSSHRSERNRFMSTPHLPTTQQQLTAAVPGMVELELRLSRLEKSLEALATTAESLRGHLGVISSVSV
ncbi:hypothetical protein C3747_35g84 [Trypanosoma cruzi]|uniref:Potassium channel domain-containing protein n=2 Tax=Trypanosoma cruzi TaxID=5693 RepID=Q4DUL8_TRYCC|nr:hypothetical protein, conserved [Trypanosoma cruzi]EAN96222.1 hypothetical protein, conserved [Trypanosoma cruzi]PWV14543.1 hypothetical protein C3747_35g84 [Trypanosoma cruzi]RNC46621.1 ion transport protein [Trypanosoma cruzi]|eukprot:XP_818073.1 hypothetical protein [Trypanosoma cruzi strain CL Brener]